MIPLPVGQSSPIIGGSVHDLRTPALVLRPEIVESNIKAMSADMSHFGKDLRPHFKAHKCVEIALLQQAAGARGVTVATVLEANALADVGFTDLFVANQVVGIEKISRLLDAVDSGASIRVAIDDPSNALAIGEAANCRGLRVPVLLEVDIGMQRAGARSVDEALSIAGVIGDVEGLVLRGITGYEGHCLRELVPSVRRARAIEAVSILEEYLDSLRDAGHEVDVVSAGGTGTYEGTASLDIVTEIQAGTYVFMDGFHARLVPKFDIGLTVATTVVSRHADCVVMDAGRKTIAPDMGLPAIRNMAITPRYLAEEHTLFDMQEGLEGLKVGDVVELVPDYAPSTVNLFEGYYVLEDDTVIDVWPVVARSGSFDRSGMSR